MRLYGVAPGRRAVVASANEHGYEVALDLLDAGVEVAAIAELRQTPRAPRRRGAGRVMVHQEPPLPRRSATATSPACASPQSRAKAVRAERAGHRVRLRGDQRRLRPAGNLIWYAGGRFAYDEDTAMHRVFELPQGVVPAGSVNGVWNLDSVLADGRRAGWHAARVLGRDRRAAAGAA